MYNERQSFEQEAIDTLIAEMENKRNKICIILAGYKKEMQQLLSMNAGFSSRINFHIDFENYTPDELYTIFKQMCKTENYKLEPRIKKLLLDHFELANKYDNLSNGRYVRNMFEHIKLEQAKRVAEDTAVDIDLIKAVDIKHAIEYFYEERPKEKLQIGFKATS